MTFLLFSDLHVKQSNLADCLRTCTWVAEVIDAHRPESVFFLGDWFDSRRSVDIPTIRCSLQMHDIVAASCNNVASKYYLILGNHDIYAEGVSAMEMFNGRGGAVVVDTPTRVFIGDGCCVLLFPYYKDAGVFASARKSILDSTADKVSFACIHQDVRGAKYTPTYVCDAGVDPDTFDVPYFCGHHHFPGNDGKVVLIGSCMYHDWNDEVTVIPRGVTVIEVNNAGDVCDHEVFENPVTPLFRTVDAHKGFGLEDVLLIPEASKTNLRILCSSTEVEDFTKVCMLDEFLSFTVLSSDEVSVRAETPGITVDAAPVEVVRNYVASVSTLLDTEKLVDIGSKAIAEARGCG